MLVHLLWNFLSSLPWILQLILWNSTHITHLTIHFFPHLVRQQTEYISLEFLDHTPLWDTELQMCLYASVSSTRMSAP